MAYYIGFLKTSPKHTVVFRSVVKPKKKDLTYFLKIVGPFADEGEAYHCLYELKKDYGVRDNPVKDPITKRDIIRAIGLTRKVVKMYGKIRKKNPGQGYHEQKFVQYMSQLEKYVVGSKLYMMILAKAYEHVKSIRDGKE